MLIDFISSKIGLEHLTPEARQKLTEIGDRLCCYCPKTGAIRYETAVWESIRSDTHQIVCKVGTHLHIQGSPARVCGDSDAVFGSGSSSSLDVVGSLQKMINHLEAFLGVKLPPALSFSVTRLDITSSLLLADLADVRVALSVLSLTAGGRYKVNAKQGDSIYWNQGSKHRSGKAYAKGPHLVYMQKQKNYSGRKYSTSELQIANRLLRLELTLAREFFKKNKWYELTSEMFKKEWESYFFRMIGGTEIVNELDVQTRVIAAAQAMQVGVDKKTGEPRFGTALAGRAAYACWCMIRSEGWQRTKEIYAGNNTWYRHMRIIRMAGLSDTDISTGKIVTLRRKIVECKQVHSWADCA